MNRDFSLWIFCHSFHPLIDKMCVFLFDCVCQIVWLWGCDINNSTSVEPDILVCWWPRRRTIKLMTPLRVSGPRGDNYTSIKHICKKLNKKCIWRVTKNYKIFGSLDGLLTKPLNGVNFELHCESWQIRNLTPYSIIHSDAMMWIQSENMQGEWLLSMFRYGC